VLLVIQQFQLESRTFFQIMLLGGVGFLVHSLLPLPYRLPFFTLVPFAGILVAMGPVDGISLIVLGLVLIGICDLLADDLIQWTLQRIAKVTRDHGAAPVFIALDTVVDPPIIEPRAVKDEGAAGFVVFNLFSLWQNRDKSALRVAEWDEHPNVAGNQVIADRLFELIRQH
jgi:hypothetical protein